MSLFSNQNAANITDQETVTIRTQTWAKKNLARTCFRNGDPILVASSSTQFSTAGAAGIPACFPYYNRTAVSTSTLATQTKNASIYAAEYGYLYNYWALIDSRSIAPEGFRIPSSTEILALYDSVGGASVAGGNLKELGSTHWNANSIIETSNSGSFNWLPGGRYDTVDGLANINDYGYLGTNTRASATQNKRYRVDYDTVQAYIVESGNSSTGVYRVFANGHSARCIKITQEDLPTVTIDTQKWTTKNLDITTYSDGTPIPEVTSSTAWVNLTTGAWCHYEDNFASGSVYGKLYNWYAVAGIYDATSAADPTKRKSLAPIGYHIPTSTEWDILTGSLGGASVAGGKMKETGSVRWAFSPTSGSTNSSGFTALPGGYRIPNGTFGEIRDKGVWWTSDNVGGSNANNIDLQYDTAEFFTGLNFKSFGMSVRLLSGSI